MMVKISVYLMFREKENPQCWYIRIKNSDSFAYIPYNRTIFYRTQRS